MSTSVMASRTTPLWEAPNFSFDVPDQATEWEKFYTRAIDFIEALDTYPDKEDESKQDGQQIKMIFQGEDRQVL